MIKPKVQSDNSNSLPVTVSSEAMSLVKGKILKAKPQYRTRAYNWCILATKTKSRMISSTWNNERHQ